MNFYIVNKEYVRYLKQFDSKVSDIDYENRLKPYVRCGIRNKFFKILRSNFFL